LITKYQSHWLTI